MLPPQFSPLFPQAAPRIPVGGASTFLLGPCSPSLPQSLPTGQELPLLPEGHFLSRYDSKNRNFKNRNKRSDNPGNLCRWSLNLKTITSRLFENSQCLKQSSGSYPTRQVLSTPLLLYKMENTAFPTHFKSQMLLNSICC